MQKNELLANIEIAINAWIYYTSQCVLVGKNISSRASLKELLLFSKIWWWWDEWCQPLCCQETITGCRKLLLPAEKRFGTCVKGWIFTCVFLYVLNQGNIMWAAEVLSLHLILRLFARSHPLQDADLHEVRLHSCNEMFCCKGANHWTSVVP